MIQGKTPRSRFGTTLFEGCVSRSRLFGNDSMGTTYLLLKASFPSFPIPYGNDMGRHGYRESFPSRTNTRRVLVGNDPTGTPTRALTCVGMWV